MNAQREPVSPWNPSRRATARVKDVLPAPTTCPHCIGKVELVENDRIYGRHFGEWPWAYLCIGCRAYVGLHPFTNIPLGTLATAPIREARKLAKAAFNPLWQSGRMTRSDAYAWLASAIGVPVGQCHIGWFDEARCQEVVAAVTAASQVVHSTGERTASIKGPRLRTQATVDGRMKQTGSLKEDGQHE